MKTKVKRLMTPEQVREGCNNKKLTKTGSVTVIATIPVSKTTETLGIQFWSPEDVERGYRQNSDSMIFTFVELY